MLQNVFNYALPTAKAGAAAGQEALGGAQNYWQRLVSGNRGTIMRAIAPETGAIAQGTAARTRQLAASGTARGGGVAASNQQLHDQAMQEIDNAILGARPQAAQELGQVGQAEMADALNALGLGGRTAADLTSIAAKSRPISAGLNQQMQQNVVGSVLGALGGL
jgi:hypothetical protein